MDPSLPSESPSAIPDGRIGTGRMLTIVFLYALFAALWILLSDKVIEWLFDDPEILVLASTLKGLVFVAITSMLLYGAMRRLLGPGNIKPGLKKQRHQLLLPLAMLTVAILGLTGIVIYHTVVHQKEKVHTQLQAIADLQTRQIESWLDERYSGARFVQNNHFWIQLYQRWRDEQDVASWQLLKARMDNFREHNAFQGILFFSKNGELLWNSEKGDLDIHVALGAVIKRLARADHQLTYLGPYRDETGHLHLDFFAPLMVDGDRPRPIVVLHVDPVQHLFPLLAPWPISSLSGETLLFRRDGEEILFLSALRHQTDSAANLRLPASRKDLLTAKILREAAAPGALVEGLDYRGMPVVGVAKAIRGTDWYLQAKLDQAELMSILGQDIVWIAIAGLFALFVGGAGTLFFRQRQKLDMALRESEIKAEKIRSLQLLHAISEGSGDAIFAKDTAGRYLFFNREAARLTGKDAQAVLGQDDMALFPENQATMIMDNDRLVMEKNQIMSFHENLSPVKDIIRFLSIKGPLHDDQGNVMGMFGISRDISELKRVEEALRKSEQRLSMALQAGRGGAWDWDLSTGEAWWSAEMYPLWGIEPGERMVLENSLANVHEADRKRLQQTVEQAIAQRTDFRCEFRIYHPRQGEKWMASRGRLEFDESGQPIYLRGITLDISERKEIEAETARLQSRVQQVQKMESIGNLAGGIAHDFNNILFPIIGFSELLLDALPADQPEREHLHEVIAAAKRGGELVNQILTFSRRTEHKKVPVRIQQILKEVLKLVRATIPSDIVISRDIQNDCQLVMADPTQLHQIAMNLITNAYHAVEENRGNITVSLKAVELGPEDVAGWMIDPGRYARLSVVDSGYGIAPDIMERIFDPYFTTKAQGKGTGMGLSVVYGIIREHDGDIQVYSEPQNGSTFTVYLPLLERCADPAIPVKGDDLPLGGEWILLVDDEAAVVRLEKQMLERLGYRVTAHINSLEALADFRNDPGRFDLVLTDMTMPNMTGEQLAKKLKRIRPSIPVAICTGFSERLSKEKAVDMGIDRFLMKPVARSEMAHMVRELLDGRNGPKSN